MEVFIQIVHKFEDGVEIMVRDVRFFKDCDEWVHGIDAVWFGGCLKLGELSEARRVT